MWAEIKASINSTVGKNLKPLDVLLAKQAYINLYHNLKAIQANTDGLYKVYVQSTNTPVLTQNALVDDAAGSTGAEIYALSPSVVLIDYGAFNQFSVKEIILPPGVEILQQAFADVTIEKIIIPTGVKNIPMYAFQGSTLGSIVLSDDIKTIDAFAFRNCTSLKEVIFEGTPTEIGSDAFANTSGATIYVPWKDEEHSDFDTVLSNNGNNTIWHNYGG